MLSFLIFFFQGINHSLQMFFVPQEISICCINKKCFQIMLLYIMRISFLDIKKIFIRYILFVWAFAFPDILLQFTHWRMQVDKKVRLDELLVNDLEQPLV